MNSFRLFELALGLWLRLRSTADDAVLVSPSIGIQVHFGANGPSFTARPVLADLLDSGGLGSYHENCGYKETTSVKPWESFI